MHDPEMKKLYQRTRARHGHQKAVIRVANKMLKIIWCMLTRREPYRDMRDGLYKSKPGKDGEDSRIGAGLEEKNR